MSDASFSVGTRVRVTLADKLLDRFFIVCSLQNEGFAYGTVQEMPTYPSCWYRLKLDNGTAHKCRVGSLERVPAASPTRDRAAASKDRKAKSDSIPTVASPKLSGSHGDGPQPKGGSSRPPVYLVELDQDAWIGLRVKVPAGKQVDKDTVGRVTSCKQGWVTIAVEGIPSSAQPAKRRPCDLEVVGDTSKVPRRRAGTRDAAPDSTSRGLQPRGADGNNSEGSDGSRDSGDDDSDDDTHAKLRQLVGETVRITAGAGIGKVGFVKEFLPDGESFILTLVEGDVTKKRGQFRKTNNPAHVQAAIAAITGRDADSGGQGGAGRTLPPRRSRPYPVNFSVARADDADSLDKGMPGRGPPRRGASDPDTVSERPTPVAAPTAGADTGVAASAAAAAAPERRGNGPRDVRSAEGSEVGGSDDESRDQPSHSEAGDANEGKGDADVPDDSSTGTDQPGGSGKRARKRRGKIPHGRGDSILEEELRMMTSDNVSSMLDSLGLSEEDRRALAEGLTPRRSNRSVRRPDSTYFIQSSGISPSSGAPYAPTAVVPAAPADTSAQSPAGLPPGYTWINQRVVLHDGRKGVVANKASSGLYTIAIDKPGPGKGRVPSKGSYSELHSRMEFSLDRDYIPMSPEPEDLVSNDENDNSQKESASKHVSLNGEEGVVASDAESGDTGKRVYKTRRSKDAAASQLTAPPGKRRNRPVPEPASAKPAKLRRSEGDGGHAEVSAASAGRHSEEQGDTAERPEDAASDRRHQHGNRATEERREEREEDSDDEDGQEEEAPVECIATSRPRRSVGPPIQYTPGVTHHQPATVPAKRRRSDKPNQQDSDAAAVAIGSVASSVGGEDENEGGLPIRKPTAKPKGRGKPAQARQQQDEDVTRHAGDMSRPPTPSGGEMDSTGAPSRSRTPDADSGDIRGNTASPRAERKRPHRKLHRLSDDESGLERSLHRKRAHKKLNRKVGARIGSRSMVPDVTSYTDDMDDMDMDDAGAMDNAASYRRPLKSIGGMTQPPLAQPVAMTIFERLKFYIQRMTEKHMNEKRTNLTPFKDKLDLAEPGDIFASRHKEWTKSEPIAMAASGTDTGAESNGVKGPFRRNLVDRRKHSVSSPTITGLAAPAPEELGGTAAVVSTATAAASLIGLATRHQASKIRFYKLGSNRLTKLSGLALGQDVPDSSSDEDSDDDYERCNLKNDPYLHPYTYKYDAAVDRAAAKGSHRRPPYFGFRSFATYVATQEEHLIYGPTAPLLKGLAVDAVATTAATSAGETTSAPAVAATSAVAPLGASAKAAAASMNSAVAARVPYVIRPAADYNTFYAYERCIHCGVPKDDGRDKCWNIACVLCPLYEVPDSQRGGLSPRTGEGRPAKRPRPDVHLTQTAAVLDGACKVEPELMALVPGCSLKVPAAHVYKDPAAASCIQATTATIIESAVLEARQGALSLDLPLLETPVGRAAIPIYYNMAYDSTARRYFAGRRLSDPMNGSTRQLPRVSVWSDSREDSSDEDEAVESAVTGTAGADVAKSEEPSHSRAHAIPSIGRPWKRGAVAAMLQAQQELERLAGGVGSSAASPLGGLAEREQHQKKKRKKRKGPKQKIVIKGGWTYVIDEESDPEASKPAADAGQPVTQAEIDTSDSIAGLMSLAEGVVKKEAPPSRPVRAMLHRKDYGVTGIYHSDPDPHAVMQMEIARDRSFDLYYADADPYVDPSTHHPPEIYPMDPLARDSVYTLTGVLGPSHPGSAVGTSAAQDQSTANASLTGAPISIGAVSDTGTGAKARARSDVEVDDVAVGTPTAAGYASTPLSSSAAGGLNGPLSALALTAPASLRTRSDSAVSTAGDDADDLLPDSAVAKAFAADAAFRLAATAEAQLLSDYRFDAPIQFLGRRFVPRAEWCGDNTNDLSLSHSLGQALDDYYLTYAATAHQGMIDEIMTKAATSTMEDKPSIADARAMLNRPGYPTIETAYYGTGGGDILSDGLQYRVSSWARGDEKEHPDLDGASLLMTMSATQLPLEEHKALSRLTHERVAEVHKRHVEKNKPGSGVPPGNHLTSPTASESTAMPQPATSVLSEPHLAHKPGQIVGVLDGNASAADGPSGSGSILQAEQSYGGSMASDPVFADYLDMLEGLIDSAVGSQVAGPFADSTSAIGGGLGESSYNETAVYARRPLDDEMNGQFG